VNAFVQEAFEHKSFFTRLHHFVLTSDAFVVVPGGIGTVLELLMVWQLLQVHHLKDTPLILVGKMWSGLLEWARSQLLTTEPPLANPEDVDLPVCVNSADEAIGLIRAHHQRWLQTQQPEMPE
jgi:predicted Rossmann-fold nucleotide-binding protein